MDGALDLNPQELPPVFNPDVVALGVAPGPGNVQPMFGGAGHKLQFCPLPAFFVVPQKDRALLFYLQLYYINWKYQFGTCFLEIYMPSQHEHSRFRLVSAH